MIPALLRLLSTLQGSAMAQPQQDQTVELDFSQPAQVAGPVTLGQIYRSYQGQPGTSTDVALPQQIQSDVEKLKAVEEKNQQVKPSIFSQDVPGYAMRLKDEFPDLPDYAIAGILGNFGHETRGFELTQEQGMKTGRGGLGLPQLTGPRRKAFETFLVKKFGEIPSDREVLQNASLDYAIQELKSPEYSNLLSKLKKSKNLKDAVVTFEKSFERADPFKKHMSSRLLYAKQAETLLKRYTKK